MSFKEVNSGNKKKRTVKVGYIKKATKYDGFYFKPNSFLTLILHDTNSGEYYRIHKLPAIIAEDNSDPNMVFNLEVDLDNEKLVELVGIDGS